MRAAPAMARMGDEGHVRVLPHQAVEIGKPNDHRRDQHGVDARIGGERDLPAQAVEIAREARRIARARSSAALDGAEPRQIASTRAANGE